MEEYDDGAIMAHRVTYTPTCNACRHHITNRRTDERTNSNRQRLLSVGADGGGYTSLVYQ